MQEALHQLAVMVRDLPQEYVPQAYSALTQATTVLEMHTNELKSRLLLEATARGERYTEAGSTRFTAEVDGTRYLVSAIPTRTGPDPRKLEAALRNRHLIPGEWMDEVKSYKVNPYKFGRLVEEGILSTADVAAVQYEKSYRLQVTEVSQPAVQKESTP
jgi:hypothetical protein